ncbi:MAG: hypothetical protein Q9227_005769 [Pyrenula ochraceoflavens]
MICASKAARYHLPYGEGFDPAGTPLPEFLNSRWFTRGWTLQELIAPVEVVVFYNRDWKRIALRQKISHVLKRITGIEENVFHMFGTAGHRVGVRMLLSQFSVAQRMSWASKRRTTRVEDLAYCLMGLFNGHIPLLYEEGERSFLRLQEDIIQHSDDESIFAWRLGLAQLPLTRTTGLLAELPADFAGSGHVVRGEGLGSSSPWSSTNRGFRVTLQLALCGRLDELYHWRRPKKLAFLSRYTKKSNDKSVPIYMVTLNCSSLQDQDNNKLNDIRFLPVIWITRVSKQGQYARIFPQELLTMELAMSRARKTALQTICTQD